MKFFYSLILLQLFLMKGLAQSGTLDPGFGTGGIVTTAIGTTSSIGDIIVQPDGKPVVAGLYVNGVNGFDFALARYNYDGTPDNSFGTGGVATLVAGNTYGGLNSIALQTDGKIVAAGYIDGGANKDIVVARFTANGTPDISFGTGGMVISHVDDFDDFSYDVLVQPDGKILAAGHYNGTSTGFNSAIALLRFNANGTPDNSFGTNGIVTALVGPSHTFLAAITLQADGKILVAGNSMVDNTSSYEDFIILRFNSNGSPDNSFDGDGRLLFGMGNNARDELKSIVVRPDGKILAAGQTNNISTINRYVVCQLNVNGSFDNGFGTNGILVVDPQAADYNFLADMFLQPDGKLLICGTNSTTAAITDFIMYRFLPSGLADPVFGNNGKVITDFRLIDNAYCMTAQNSRIYLAGSSSANPLGFNPEFTIAAYRNCFAPAIVTTDLDNAVCKGSLFHGYTIGADTIIIDTLKSQCLFDSAINRYHLKVSNPDTIVNRDSTVCYGGLYKGNKVFSSFLDTDTVQVPHPGCGSRAQISKVQVLVTPEIINAFGEDTLLCPGGSLRLNAFQPALSYLWQDNSTGSGLTVRSPGICWVEVTDNYHCRARDSITVTLSDLVLSIKPDTTILPGQSVTLIPQTNGMVTWVADPTLSCTACQLTVASPADTHSYTAGATKDGCLLTATTRVIIKRAPYIYVPAAFTPNNDGRNDVFRVTTNISGPFSLRIYDRYGEVVFTTGNPSRGWDGTLRGAIQSSGVYVYMIRYQETHNSEMKILKGTLVLIR